LKFRTLENNKKTTCKKEELRLNDNFKKIEKYQAGLQKFLEVRVKSKAIALELTQDTFERYITMDSPEKIEFPRAFLFRIASNLALNHLRREKIYLVQGEQEEDFQENVFSEEPSPEEWARYEEIQAKFKTAYLDLPLRCQEVFYLRRVSELSTKEIADKLGISQRMVQKYLIRIMKHFRKQLLSDEKN
jgi:RNA polymerase sigma-70 factor (ECF subfamily)